MRHDARHLLEKAGLVRPHEDVDVGHIHHVGDGVVYGNPNRRSNLEVEKPGANRSFERNPNGSMKSEVSKRERAGKDLDTKNDS